jgi:glycosyltransferase involved in cell wall biosynthesis
VDFMSPFVKAYYIRVKYVSILQWFLFFIKGKIITPIKDLWSVTSVSSYEVLLPKLPTRVTGNSFLKDVEWASSLLYFLIRKSIPKIDCIHLHIVMPYGLYAIKLKEKYKCSLIIQEHSNPFSMHTDSNEKRKYLELIFDKTNLIVAVGEVLKNQIDEMFNKKCNVIFLPNIVRTDVFLPGEKKIANQNIIRMINVGSLQVSKGIPFLLKTLTQLKNDNILFSLVIVCTSSYDDIVQLVKSSEHAQNIQVINRVDKKELRNLFLNCDIYVCPSYTETFGLAPAEAIATGLPAVSVTCGGPELFIDQSCGLVIDSHDSSKMARAIYYTWENKSTYDPHFMHKHIENLYRPGIYVENFLNLYHTHML